MNKSTDIRGGIVAPAQPPVERDEREVVIPIPLPVEQWAKAKATPAWLFRAAKARQRWPIGAELTEAQYEAALAAVLNITVR